MLVTPSRRVLRGLFSFIALAVDLSVVQAAYAQVPRRRFSLPSSASRALLLSYGLGMPMASGPGFGHADSERYRRC